LWVRGPFIDRRAASPAQDRVQIYSQGLMTQMTVRMQDDPLEKTLAWAEGKVGGYLRT
jgi:hypothetical protein